MRPGRGLIVGALVLLVGMTAFVTWRDRRDPLALLPRPHHDLTADRAPAAVADGRRIEHVVLHDPKRGDIGLVISLPEPLPAKPLPILFVLGGLGTGESNIRYLADAGDNAIVGYDWPIPVRFYDGPAGFLRLMKLYRRLMAIPAQVTSALEWLAAEPWADRRISLLGFSLGALAAPAIAHVAERDGRPIGWTILAYGGAPLGDLVAANPHVRPGWVRALLAPIVDGLLAPLQPTRHLPDLTSQFLVLEGADDALVPAAAQARLRDAVPEPKTVERLAGDHVGVGPDKAAVLAKIIADSKGWLIDKGAIDPF